MQTSIRGEDKELVDDQRAAQRFGTALRLTVEGEEGATHDMSATGLCFEFDRHYEVGSTIELVIEYPGGTRMHPLACEAEVVRVVPAGEQFNIGVRLLTPLFAEPVPLSGPPKRSVPARRPSADASGPG